MNKIKILFLSMIPVLGLGQPISKCDLNAIKLAYLNADNLSEKVCLDFILSIDTVCKNDVEFGEFSNETIFKILDKSPLVLLKTMDNFKSKINTQLILLMIQDPIQDGFDLIGIKKKIQGLDLKTDCKDEVIKSIDIAIDKR